ncbi:hypothetical protein HRI_001677100 [Hibiscus trionum]|uniref:Integrase zinc-binding domain-containing protein n=1 Tax=Hibiscus trionum TaxID=183268 RepID=A0A9W7HNP1_HIBTR|nr:hypothetical protein HRI_001677100 [Hibiscus trionum]
MVYVGDTGQLRQQLLHTLHDPPQGDHSGILATYHRLKASFYWSGMKYVVKTYVQSCDFCQKTKDEHVATPGLLQPLPVPKTAWDITTIDFIKGLPTSLKFN